MQELVKMITSALPSPVQMLNVTASPTMVAQQAEVLPQVQIQAPAVNVDISQNVTSNAGNGSQDVPVPSPQEAEQAKISYLEKASAAYRAFFYPMGEVKFTIYKDSTGQYITRFTSLIDGTVTHIPEQNILDSMSRLTADVGSVFSTSI